MNPRKLTAFLDKTGADIGIAMTAALVYIGQKLGLYKAMAGAGPLNSQELAQRTNTSERYIREWLLNQAACGYLEYDPQTQKYSLPPEHALALVDENSPYYVGGFFSAKAVLQATDRILEAFQTGKGVPWAEQDPDLFSGTEASFRPVYEAYLLKYWIPSLHVDVQKKLVEGGRVADVGCGFGASTLIMARAFRNSQFHGFDSHPASMEHAAALAASEGMEQSVHFQVARSTEFPGGPYDLITFFTCLHDMADPVAAMKRAYETLDENGSVMIVETMAGERSEDNFNPLGVIFSAVSTLCCVPNAIAGGGKAMGAVATGNVIRETATAGGFKSVHRVSQGLLNRVYEARR